VNGNMQTDKRSSTDHSPLAEVNSIIARYYLATGKYVGAWKFVLNSILVAEGLLQNYRQPCSQEAAKGLPLLSGLKITRGESEAILSHDDDPQARAAKKRGFELEKQPSSDECLLPVIVSWQCVLSAGLSGPSTIPLGETTVQLFEETMDFCPHMIAKGWKMERALRGHIPSARVTMTIRIPDSGI
jgi:hypothetical protein